MVVDFFRTLRRRFGGSFGGVGRVMAPVGSDRWRSTGQQIGIYRIDDSSMVHADVSIRVVNELVLRVRRNLGLSNCGIVLTTLEQG